MSFFGFIGNVLKAGIGVATHGLINLGGGSSGGVPSAAALPSVSLPFRSFTGGAASPRMPAFSPLAPVSSTQIGGGGGSSLIPHFACGPGMHHAKVHGHHLLASKCVRNRHMNVTNPKALRRSIRRLYGAEKMYARLLRVTHPQKIKGGRVHPKPPRRRKS